MQTLNVVFLIPNYFAEVVVACNVIYNNLLFISILQRALAAKVETPCPAFLEALHGLEAGAAQGTAATCLQRPRLTLVPQGRGQLVT